MGCLGTSTSLRDSAFSVATYFLFIKLLCELVTPAVDIGAMVVVRSQLSRI